MSYQMKSADLTTAVRQKLIGADGARSHLVDVVRWLLLSIYLHAFSITEFIRRDPGLKRVGIAQPLNAGSFGGRQA